MNIYYFRERELLERRERKRKGKGKGENA